MLTLKQEKYSGLGYLWCTDTNNRHFTSWLQFADDAIIVSNNDKNAQVLLNVFIAWCEWSGMLIRIEKTHSLTYRIIIDVKYNVNSIII